MNTKNLKSFSYLEDGTISHSILSIIETKECLKPGFYKLEGVPEQWTFKPQLSVESLPNLPLKNLNYKELDSFSAYLDNFIKSDKKEKVESLGYKHKLGLLLHGKQGTGKTVITSFYANKIIESEGIVINVNTSMINACPILLDFLRDIRKVHTNLMLLIFDESEEVLSKMENEFKNFLDGYSSIDNSISIFTTNYLDKIPKAIYERPSRIRFSVELKGISDEETIRNIVKNALNRDLTDSELKQLMGNTIDEIKEFILNEIMGADFKKKSNSKKIGFN